jgi:hypothetical protein
MTLGSALYLTLPSLCEHRSRFTVRGETPIAAAVSSIDMPPKKRHSQLPRCRG